jgi:hypothetical protein
MPLANDGLASSYFSIEPTGNRGIKKGTLSNAVDTSSPSG